VVNGEMRFNGGRNRPALLGDIPHHFLHAMLDAMVIMPNDVHGIIVIRESCRGERFFAPTFALTATSERYPTGAVI
jgi:hypothetical protein